MHSKIGSNGSLMSDMFVIDTAVGRICSRWFQEPVTVERRHLRVTLAKNTNCNVDKACITSGLSCISSADYFEDVEFPRSYALRFWDAAHGAGKFLRDCRIDCFRELYTARAQEIRLVKSNAEVLQKSFLERKSAAAKNSAPEQGVPRSQFCGRYLGSFASILLSNTQLPCRSRRSVDR